MKKVLIICSFFLITEAVFSQCPEWRMSVMGGTNRVSLGPGPSNKRVGASIFYSTGFLIKNHKSTFTFEPSLAYGRNTYVLESDNSYYVDVKQNNYLSVLLQAGFRISNNLYFKMGCLVNTSFTEKGNTLYAHNWPNGKEPDFDIPEVYYPTERQVSFVSGFTFYCDKAQTVAFEMQAQQNVNGVLKQDFYVQSNWQNKQGSVLVASKKSKPVVLLVGINIKLCCINCFKDVRPRYNKLKQKPFGVS